MDCMIDDDCRYDGPETDKVDDWREGQTAIQFLHEKLQTIMMAIKKRKGFSFTPVNVIIECAGMP